MNVRLLRKVQKQILLEPAQFVMDAFFLSNLEELDWSSDLKRKRIPNCGTAACIAGWALALDKAKTPADIKAPLGRFCDYEGMAEGVLGIDFEQSDKLFYAKNWPEPFCGRFFKAVQLKTRAKIAVARIEHFIKTKGRE